MQSWKLQAAKSETELKEFINELYQDAMHKVLNIRLITIWYRRVKNKYGSEVWDFNHIEDGHCVNNHPTSKMPIHNQSWKGGKWAKAHVQLNGANRVVGYYIIHKEST